MANIYIFIHYWRTADPWGSHGGLLSLIIFSLLSKFCWNFWYTWICYFTLPLNIFSYGNSLWLFVFNISQLYMCIISSFPHIYRRFVFLCLENYRICLPSYFLQQTFHVFVQLITCCLEGVGTQPFQCKYIQFLCLYYRTERIL